MMQNQLLCAVSFMQQASAPQTVFIFMACYLTVVARVFDKSTKRHSMIPAAKCISILFICSLLVHGRDMRCLLLHALLCVCML